MNAKEYLKHWETLDHDRVLGCQKHQERLKRCADFMDGDIIADVGCAFGHSTNIMKKFYPASWTGIDFCNETIATAREKFPDISFRYISEIGKLEMLGKFDSCVCSEVIEHVEKDRLLVEKLIDITGKRLIITTPNIKVNDPGHLRLYNQKSIKDLLNGLCDYNLESMGSFYYIKIIREVRT